MKVVYIAGPYRDSRGLWFIQQNIQAAAQAALGVWRLGAVALCPHTNSALMDGGAPDDVFLAGGWELLLRSDAVYVFSPNYQASRGTLAEIELAMEKKIPVFYSLHNVRQWLVGVSGERLTSPTEKERQDET